MFEIHQEIRFLIHDYMIINGIEPNTLILGKEEYRQFIIDESTLHDLEKPNLKNITTTQYCGLNIYQSVDEHCLRVGYTVNSQSKEFVKEEVIKIKNLKSSYNCPRTIDTEPNCLELIIITYTPF